MYPVVLGLFLKFVETGRALQLCTYEQELLKMIGKATLFLHMAEICSKYLNLNDDAVRCVKEATAYPRLQTAVHYEQMIDDVEDVKDSNRKIT